MKIIIFYIILIFLLGCDELPKKSNIEIKKKDLINTIMPTKNLNQIRNYSDTSYYSDVPILLKRLYINGYKFPSETDFKSAIIKIFGIDIDTARYDNISDPNSAFIILRKDGFVYFNVSGELTPKDTSRSNDMFLQINNYIFNNSIEARIILKDKKPRSLNQLILTSGYPIVGDKLVADAYFKDSSKEIFTREEATYFLCNLVEGKIAGLKNNLAAFLAKNYPWTFYKSTINILSPEPTDEDIYGYQFTNNDVKFRCWGQIVDIGWHIHDISYFIDVFENHKGLSAFYKKHNYYGLKGLERFCMLYDKYGVEDPNKFQPQDAFWEEAPYSFE